MQTEMGALGAGAEEHGVGVVGEEDPTQSVWGGGTKVFGCAWLLVKSLCQGSHQPITTQHLIGLLIQDAMSACHTHAGASPAV